MEQTRQGILQRGSAYVIAIDPCIETYGISNVIPRKLRDVSMEQRDRFDAGEPCLQAGQRGIGDIAVIDVNDLNALVSTK